MRKAAHLAFKNFQQNLSEIRARKAAFFLQRASTLAWFLKDHPSVTKNFKTLLSPKEHDWLTRYEWISEEKAERLLNRENLIPRPDAKIAFNICNKGDIQLDGVDFKASGFKLGRSTPHSLKTTDAGASTSFNSDLVIKPHECMAVTWTGPFLGFNRIEVSDIKAQWKPVLPKNVNAD